MNQAVREVIGVGPMKIRFLVEGSDSEGSVSVFERDVPAATIMAAPHSHDAFEETIYGLDGHTTWTVDGDETELGPFRRSAVFWRPPQGDHPTAPGSPW